MPSRSLRSARSATISVRPARGHETVRPDAVQPAPARGVEPVSVTRIVSPETPIDTRLLSPPEAVNVSVVPCTPVVEA
ncbi:MAG: hypothetical protein AVDCRST_MAG85-716 [uncultured Solirubrobacteraceae bacterium]|uniref:Uncharacterized protein n=1 Tax=uncultured Solirubrobacteraceae bacterium TaxID=1162706 RepID=A0A6J4S371_9ACTN|nr:MAG: hypothetical protein AVDCRST_MAG85-716 [uncultured Solirubrobacteraceae bacterium]